MLNYTINRRQLSNDLEEIRYYDYDVSDDLTSDDKNVVTVSTVDIDCVKVGDRVTVMLEKENTDSKQQVYPTSNYAETYTVTSVSPDGLSFTMICPKYFTLQGRDAYMIAVTDTENPQIQHVYLYIRFWDNHFFEEGMTGQTISITDDPMSETEPITVLCEYVNENTIRISQDTIKGSGNGDPDAVWNQLICMVYNVSSPAYATSSEAVMVERLTIQRSMVLLNSINLSNSTTTTMFRQKSMQYVNLPLSTTFRTDAFADDTLTQYGQAILDASINKINDLEKNVYHPVVMLGDGENTVIKEVERIVFNLHFRVRDNEGGKWEVIPGAGWNEPIPLDDEPLEGKSDLLTYLGFTNNDVRFQKNKLKRSFIRLMYYDSTDRMNNNLLATSTIFYDSAESFVKYAQMYSERENNYISVDDENRPRPNTQQSVGSATNGQESDNANTPTDGATDDSDNPNANMPTQLNGIRVTREYYPEQYPDDITMDDIEKHRLSSRFTTHNRNSEKASEGFYLYLWKDMEPKGSLYMSVDFNHAGYGRVVPMYYPYDNTGVLDYYGVMGLWSPDEAKKNDINRFFDFSYIRINYDVTKDGFHYYTIDNLYNNNGTKPYYDEATNSLIINLYEGRIYEGVES